MVTHSINDSADAVGEQVRLQKVLASAGVASRRKCEELITAGRVTVDGEVCDELGTTVDPRRQEVRLDGQRVKSEPKRIYILNKPPGYVCTNRDPAGRPLALDLVPDDRRRLFSIGRLDESSQGLLLVTNDGELANRLAHPRYRVSRRYQVQVAGSPTPETLKQLVQGMHFSDGFFRARGAKKIRSQGKSTFLEIELIEGHNRELRRLLARVGHKVLSLKRVTFGPIALGRLPLGKCRPLRPAELQALRNLTEGREQSPRASSRTRRAASRSPRATSRSPQAASRGKTRRKSNPGRKSRG